MEDLPQAQASTLVQQVLAELRRRIVDGRLAPGTVVPDSVIAKQMGVSRAPVRDACNLLVQTGMLTKRQNYPYRVRDFSAADLSELQLIRWGYESAAARQLVRSGEQPTGTEEILQRMAEAARRQDGRLSAEADIDFHRRLVQASGLPQLILRYESLADQLGILIREIPDFVLATQVHRHQEILDVLRSSQQAADARPVLAVLETHLLTRREDIEPADLAPDPGDD